MTPAERASKSTRGVIVPTLDFQLSARFPTLSTLNLERCVRLTQFVLTVVSEAF